MSDPGSSSLRVVIADEEDGERLDKFLARHFESLSRSRIQNLIAAGSVRVHGATTRASYRICGGDQVDVEIPKPRPLEVVAEDIPLVVSYEDDDLLVIDKAAGMTVHPAPGHWSGTLVNALLHRCDDLSGINGVLRPGIVHRLDRDTTGLMVIAKTDMAHHWLATQMEKRAVKRTYWSIVWGDPGDGTIDAALGRHAKNRVRIAVRKDGRSAVTHFQTRERYPFLSLIEVELETGRTHQIRVHLEHHGHPVFGDPLYGGRQRVRGIDPKHREFAQQLLALMPRQALHAGRLEFHHPSQTEKMVFEAPLPADIAAVVERLRTG